MAVRKRKSNDVRSLDFSEETSSARSKTCPCFSFHSKREKTLITGSLSCKVIRSRSQNLLRKKKKKKNLQKCTYVCVKFHT